MKVAGINVSVFRSCCAPQLVSQVGNGSRLTCRPFAPGECQDRYLLSEVANQRVHRETRERPGERFQPEALRPLPVIPYDHRDTREVIVHKDLRVQFDANKLLRAASLVGQRLTVKADSSTVTVYARVNEVVSYPRSWRRGQTFGADRFEKELPEDRPPVPRSQAQQRLFDFLDGLCSRALSKPIGAIWRTPTVRSPARSLSY